MNIPNFENIPAVTKGGYFTDSYQIILQQLISELQQNLSNEGYQLPQLTTAQITELQTRFNGDLVYFGRMVYDKTTDEVKVNIAGTFRVVQVV